jgi:signal recognition particle GTPase
MHYTMVSYVPKGIILTLKLMSCCCVQIPIFEKGYEKDPAVVAREAIQEATRNKSDVVLVDTAGRMQVD